MARHTMETIDPLAEALHHLRMNGTFYARSELTAPWGLELPASAGWLAFHVVTSGKCWLDVEGADPCLLQPGEFALVPHGRGHRLLSEPGVPASPILELPNEMVSERYSLLKHGGGGGLSTLICGAVQFDHPAAQELVALLPTIVHVRPTTALHGEWIDSTLRLMAVEAREVRPGGETVITRLADILVIQAIRSWLEQDPAAQTGWLGALQDSQIGRALALIHRKPGHDWTVENLASEVAMSRSAFAAQFRELVGETPMHYVTRWRMNSAVTALRDGTTPVQELAARLGYRSEAAFSRAFKRHVGVPPGELRRNPDLTVEGAYG